MQLSRLIRNSRRFEDVPLAWAAATHTQDYLNVGDALSPVIVSALANKKITRVPMRSLNCRMASTGSILHAFVGGEVHVWGSGISPSHNPMTQEATGWALPSDTNILVYALRGPHTMETLRKGGLAFDVMPAFGDPVILLKRFYSPPLIDDEDKCELGIIMHLSETDGRELEAGPKQSARYRIPSELGCDVKFINTLSPVCIDGLKDKIDQICSCKRVISTSFHGLLIAELYNIPCFYFGSKMVAIS